MVLVSYVYNAIKKRSTIYLKYNSRNNKLTEIKVMVVSEEVRTYV